MTHALLHHNSSAIAEDPEEMEEEFKEMFGQYPYSLFENFSLLILPLVAFQSLKSLLLKMACTLDIGLRGFELDLT